MRRVAAAAAAAVLLIGFVTVKAGCFSLPRDPHELPLGTAAPAAQVTGTDGKPFALEALREKGFPVLVFYRGHW